MSADDRRIGAETAAPQRVAEQDHAMAAHRFFLCAKIATERRPDADDLEKLRCDFERPHAFGFAVTGQVVGA